MLKEIFLQRLNLQSKTVNNAIITLGDIDDSGKGKRFKSRFIQPGLAGYPGQFGTVLVKKETLDNSLNTIIGAPVIINHTDVTEENADDLRVGVISDAYYNEKDGWYWCEGVIFDKTAQDLIINKKWSVSCSYDFLEENDEGGTENNIPYDREFTKLNFVHLALVDNPRYERANIVFNSKTVENGGEGSGNFDHAGGPGEVGGSSSTGNNQPQNVDITKLKPVDFTQEDIQRFKVHGSVQEYYQKHIKGTSITHSDKRLGEVYFDDDGLGESKNINRPKNFYLITKAPELVKAAHYDREEPATKHERNDKIVKFHLLYAKARTGNKTKLLQIKIAEDDIGKKYYFLRPVATEINNLTNSAIAKDVNNDNSSLLNSEANIIITDIQEDFNPTGENMLNNIENENWETLYDKNGEPYHVDLDDDDKTEYKVKKTTVKLKDGKEKEIEYLDKPPKGWKKNEGATTAPLGYDWYTNGKSVLTGERKSILVKDHSKIYNAKEQEMALLEELKKLINNVENGKGEEMQDKEKEKEVDNEKVDKRDIIRQIMAIAGKYEDNEDVRTIAKLAEKLGYDKSEAGSSDNKKEIKNEDDEVKEKKAKEEEKKEDTDNKKKSCDNSVENSKVDYFAKLNEIYNASTEPPKQDEYVSKADRLAEGNRF